MEGLHSPWGIIGKIIESRGWTAQQVLWGESWINIMMQLADSPKYVKSPRSVTVDTIDDLKKALGR